MTQVQPGSPTAPDALSEPFTPGSGARAQKNRQPSQSDVAKVGATVEKIEDTDLREALRALGLALSGMTQPQKIIGFLNPWRWDPSLLFVMAGAVGLHLVTYRWVRKRRSPLLDAEWHVPARRDVTARVLLGSAIFGIGWGLSGFCPGPGVESLAALEGRPALFVAAMLAGMMLFKKTERFLKLPE